MPIVLASGGTGRALYQQMQGTAQNELVKRSTCTAAALAQGALTAITEKKVFYEYHYGTQQRLG